MARGVKSGVRGGGRPQPSTKTKVVGVGGRTVPVRDNAKPTLRPGK